MTMTKSKQVSQCPSFLGGMAEMHCVHVTAYITRQVAYLANATLCDHCGLRGRGEITQGSKSEVRIARVTLMRAIYPPLPTVSESGGSALPLSFATTPYSFTPRPEPLRYWRRPLMYSTIF